MLKKFVQCESGATAIEYGLIAAFIAVAIIGSLNAVGNSSTVQLDGVADHLGPSS